MELAQDTDAIGRHGTAANRLKGDSVPLIWRVTARPGVMCRRLWGRW